MKKCEWCGSHTVEYTNMLEVDHKFYVITELGPEHRELNLCQSCQHDVGITINYCKEKHIPYYILKENK